MGKAKRMGGFHFAFKQVSRKNVFLGDMGRIHGLKTGLTICIYAKNSLSGRMKTRYCGANPGFPDSI